MMRWGWLTLTLGMMGLVACTQPVDDGSVASLTNFGYPVPQVTVEEWIWKGLPLSCEGLFEDGEQLQSAYAENDPTLGVLLLEGEPICVDTWDGIEIELERVLGDPSPDPMHPMSMELSLPEDLQE